jgi:hypothetical protein
VLIVEAHESFRLSRRTTQRFDGPLVAHHPL